MYKNFSLCVLIDNMSIFINVFVFSTEFFNIKTLLMAHKIKYLLIYHLDFFSSYLYIIYSTVEEIKIFSFKKTLCLFTIDFLKE